MIIAFYPGAVGNRYLQRLLGKKWNDLNKSYDINNIEQCYEHRYLTTDVIKPSSEYVLTHCLNSNRIQQLLPALPVVVIKSDLKSSLRREWILHGHQRYMNKNIKNTVSRLDHYCAIKDPSWPDIFNESEIDQLPVNILKEVSIDYCRVVTNTYSVPGSLVELTQSLVNKINSAYEIISWHINYYYQLYPVDIAAQQIIDIDNDDNEFSELMRQELSLYQSEIFDQVWNTLNEQR
jgi:hypothetical protein